MKNSTILFTAIFFLSVLFINHVNAQSSDPKWRFDVGFEAGIPTYQAHIISSNEYGGTARLQYTVNDDFVAMITSGYYFFPSPPNSNTYTTLGNTIYITPTLSQAVIPVKLGLKYFVSKPFYVAAEGGIGFETQYSENKKLDVAPNIGLQFDSFDLSLRYDSFLGQGYNYGLIGLRVAYGINFDIKKKK